MLTKGLLFFPKGGESGGSPYFEDNQKVMEAPDKIYVRDFGNSLCQMWSGIKGKKRNDVDIEYIRKDFLLHILAKKKEEVGIGLSEYDMGKENGKYQVLNELIEEIKVL